MKQPQLKENHFVVGHDARGQLRAFKTVSIDKHQNIMVFDIMENINPVYRKQQYNLLFADDKIKVLQFFRAMIEIYKKSIAEETNHFMKRKMILVLKRLVKYGNEANQYFNVLRWVNNEPIFKSDINDSNQNRKQQTP